MAEEWTKTTSLGFLNHKHDLNEESLCASMKAGIKIKPSTFRFVHDYDVTLQQESN